MLMTTISYPGNCDEAITFYKEVLGAQVKDINYFRDAPPEFAQSADLPPNFVMHSEVLIKGAMFAMTDGANSSFEGDNYSLLLMIETDAELADIFNKLAAGGKVIEPVAKQFWASSYGMVADKFGVMWQLSTMS